MARVLGPENRRLDTVWNAQMRPYVGSKLREQRRGYAARGEARTCRSLADLLPGRYSAEINANSENG